MNFSKNSKKLITFFTNNNHINAIKQTKQTDTIISNLYYDIVEAYKFLLDLKQKGNYYTVKTKKIENLRQLSKPVFFNDLSFPRLVKENIEQNSRLEISYTFPLYERNIKVLFILEEDNYERNLKTFSSYVDAVIIWLHILNKYASKQCAKSLTVYLYFTSLTKTLPHANYLILDEMNVNTAFTTTCPSDSEIVVFRKEEWFKAFIHETIHNFGLDFSNMNNEMVNTYILDIFRVKSKVNLFEAYTEFWAEIMNALFCSFFLLKDKNNISEFLSNSEFFINFERTYSFFQLVKILDFMGLSYQNLYSKTIHSKNLRDHLYNENTNVLSYFVIKTILMNNYQGFLYWCKNNNSNILQFNKTVSNQHAFCKFIDSNYKTGSFLNGVDETEKFIDKIKKNKKKPNLNFVLSNLRMSICELG
jgi:hypothetical protein